LTFSLPSSMRIGALWRLASWINLHELLVKQRERVPESLEREIVISLLHSIRKTVISAFVYRGRRRRWFKRGYYCNCSLDICYVTFLACQIARARCSVPMAGCLYPKERKRERDTRKVCRVGRVLLKTRRSLPSARGMRDVSTRACRDSPLLLRERTRQLPRLAAI